MNTSNRKYNYNKCDECGGTMCPYVYKGRNNNYLCGGTWYNKGCGQNICFTCGKREEEKIEWREDGTDCCGNKRVEKVCIPMFSQFERDENNPDRKLNVLYCDECQGEALKSPLKWTREDEEKEIQREKEEKIQEEREREEKLNQQKNLFFLDGRADSKSESKTVRDYGAFLGRQKGQNYYLMIPFNHPIWDNEKTDPVVKKAVENFWWDGNLEDFFIIEGVENIPLEKAPSNYWNRLSRKDKPIFHKIVGLNDKITIAEHKSNQENPEKQVENKPTGNSNSQPKELNDKTLLQYFQQKNIKSIKIENEKLIIKYNGSQTETKDINNLELEQIKSFAEKIGKNELSLADLEQKNNQSNTPDKSNKGIYISLAIGGALAIAIIAYFLLRNKKEK